MSFRDSEHGAVSYEVHELCSVLTRILVSHYSVGLQLTIEIIINVVLGKQHGLQH